MKETTSCARQGRQNAALDQSVEVRGHARRQSAVSNQKSEFDISVKRGFCEIRGCDEDRLVVGDHRLGMKHTTRTIEFKGSWVKIDARP